MTTLKPYSLSCVLLVSGLIAFATRPSAAQSPPPSGFERIPHNADLRIRLTNRSVVYGRFASWTSDSLVLVQQFGNDAGRQVALRSISMAWYRHGWQTTHGLAIGTSIGFGAGLALGAVIRNTGDLTRGQLMLAWSLTGAVAGAVSGVIAGGLTQRWDRIRGY